MTIMIGEILTDEDGYRYIVTGALVPNDRKRYASFYLTEVPFGMTAKDLGRLFLSEPTDEDPTAYALIGSQS